MWAKFLAVLTLAAFSFQAEANCIAKNEGQFRKFVCADGTIQKIAIQDGQVVILTFSPETKKWSESSFPAPYGTTLDALSVSLNQGG